MEQRYYQPEIETMKLEDMQALQSKRLVAQVKHVYENMPYYREKMEQAGVKPEDIHGIEDLHKLPFLSKDDLRDQYPYGLLATDLKNCVRIQSTSGTTGRRVVAFSTQHDVDLWEDCARAVVAAGGTNEDVCQVCYGYGLFTGGPGLNGGSHKVGCLTLPMSSGNTERQIQFMMDLQSTILCCTPSYAAYMGKSLKEHGYKPEDNHLKAGIFGAEPWTEEMRHNIEESLGIKAYDIYGLTETSGPGVAFECCEQSGMHINEDNFIPEIIDPETGKRCDKTEYPVSAIREAVLNALIHRDYSIYTEGTPIQIDFFSDRLEIHSPGSLYGRMSVEDLGFAHPDARNPVLAVMTESLTDAEHRYSGIPTMRRAMQEAGLPAPVFINRQNEFVVVLYNHPAEPENPVITSHTADKTAALLQFCRTPRTRKEIADFLGIGTVYHANKRYIQPLVEQGRLKLSIPDKPSSRKQTYTTDV